MAPIAACGSAASGLSQGKAVAEAEKFAQQEASIPVTLVSAAPGNLGEFQPDALPQDHGLEVWAVTFDGLFPPVSAGPAALPGETPRPRPASNTSATIFLNHATGAFVMSVTPASG